MEEQKKVSGYPLFEKPDSKREISNDEYSTTGDGHPDREGSTTGDGHPDRDESSTTGDGHPPRKGNGKAEKPFMDKVMDTLTGEDHSPTKK